MHELKHRSESNKSSQSSRLNVSSVESDDVSDEEGPQDDDSVLVGLGVYTFLGAWLTLLVILQSSHYSFTALLGENEDSGGPST